MHVLGFVLVWRFFCLSRSKMSASEKRTLSWCHLYLPWLRAVLHPASMCAIVPLPPHSLHDGSSLIPHLWRFFGDGRVSYTERSRKEIRKGSSLQISGHVIFHFGRSHFVQAPCTPAPFFLQVSDLGLNHVPPLPWVGFSPLLEVGGSESLPPYAWVPDDVLQLQCTFGLCH